MNKLGRLGLFVFVLVGIGCGSAMKNLRKRAAFDLDCPEKDIKTQQLGGGAVGVTGCDKKVTYVKVGEPPRTKWVLNSDTAPGAEAAAEESERKPKDAGNGPGKTQL